MKKEKRYKSKRYAILGVILAFLIVGLSIFGYFKFLKKTTAQLLEVVPENAAFVFQINDNEDFVKSISHCKTYINDVFALDALAGFEYFIDLTKEDLPNGNQLVISGHNVGGQIAVLMSVNMTEKTFDKLLNLLQLNPQDYTSYEYVKTYEVGTHYKKFVIAYHDGIFSAADHRNLIEQSIKCLNFSKSVRQSANFEPIYQLLQKNNKQNWLILNHENFVNCQTGNIDKTYLSKVAILKNLASWSAYQIRFSEDEISLFGYSLMKENSFFQQFKNQSNPNADLPEDLLPGNLNYYISLHIPDLQTYTNGTNTQGTADLLKLNATESYYFSTTCNDTLNYSYIAIKGDTSTAFISSILPENHTLDSALVYEKFKIYKSNVSQFATALSNLHKNMNANYFIDYQGYYVFSDSIQPLKKYIDDCISGNTIDKNQYYLFAKNNLPSENRFQLFFQNQNQYLNRFFSKSFSQKRSALENLKVFSYTFSQPINNLIPNNIYIKFATN